MSLKRNILIVEDDKSFGLLLKGWFISNGYNISLAVCVEEAKRMLSEALYDLVLTDLRLPDGDGLMIMSWSKSEGYNSPFIIMTSYADVPTAVAAMRMGAVDFLEKPINNDTIKEKIEAALNHSENLNFQQHEKEDIERIANFFLQQANEEHNRNILGFTEQAMSKMAQYSWPSKIKEIREVVFKAALFAKGEYIDVLHLPINILSETSSNIFTTDKTSSEPKEEEIVYIKGVNELEAIHKALKRTGGNKSLAADLLGIDRKTLYNKLK